MCDRENTDELDELVNDNSVVEAEDDPDDVEFDSDLADMVDPDLTEEIDPDDADSVEE